VSTQLSTGQSLSDTAVLLWVNHYNIPYGHGLQHQPATLCDHSLQHQWHFLSKLTATLLLYITTALLLKTVMLHEILLSDIRSWHAAILLLSTSPAVFLITSRLHFVLISLWLTVDASIPQCFTARWYTSNTFCLHGSCFASAGDQVGLTSVMTMSVQSSSKATRWMLWQPSTHSTT